MLHFKHTFGSRHDLEKNLRQMLTEILHPLPLPFIQAVLLTKILINTDKPTPIKNPQSSNIQQVPLP